MDACKGQNLVASATGRMEKGTHSAGAGASRPASRRAYRNRRPPRPHPRAGARRPTGRRPPRSSRRPPPAGHPAGPPRPRRGGLRPRSHHSLWRYRTVRLAGLPQLERIKLTLDSGRTRGRHHLSSFLLPTTAQQPSSQAALPAMLSGLQYVSQLAQRLAGVGDSQEG